MNTCQFSTSQEFYRGKVRDVYRIDGEYIIMMASNRISAFDVVLPRDIPYKGQVLNQIAAWMLAATRDICPNWLQAVPAPNVSAGLLCKPFKIEMVIRGHLMGHAWRTYSGGGRSLCGAPMPDGLRENDPFPTPIITPSTKADAGHDEDINPDEIIGRGLASPEQWEQLCRYSLALFGRGQEIARKQGLILADTKYEFGLYKGEIYLMDEVHTPDSSRYFYADGFDERLRTGERQKQLSKEFVREWLIANDFMGKPGQTVPEMTDEWVDTISKRYIELYEKVIGEPFTPETLTATDTCERAKAALEQLRNAV